ncbi:hypothetical protein E5F05_17265 [Deinococcus metallilatus]|uniref:Uncharacterized protein n=1 Tax=Deinococcus metallilatus TaxID=1211322 RepID=A0AAJ5F7W2_9DEIO|nr:hypothetical protein [Deinococcus metallilatus]MBB5294736.1 hypothetical protein [Deinococcus metallilatus]QBY09532.1 hypothetical protein E5F05_17265 [Deinococcus metallilatus]RXJ09537.1 hypothetical protein ERJ73_16105 [Deinococcus metallilatus]TLK29059.1 hypothetical protein FCS05_07870 [Deinococcus metallilatus]GMA16662.1 hypothetical protein GCM10025871_29930 [Deinococcus metallilatus]
MAADHPWTLLLTGVARGRGGTAMVLELLAVLHEQGLLTEEQVGRVVNALAADMRDFDAQLVKAELRPSSTALKG